MIDLSAQRGKVTPDVEALRRRPTGAQQDLDRPHPRRVRVVIATVIDGDVADGRLGRELDRNPIQSEADGVDSRCAESISSVALVAELSHSLVDAMMGGKVPA